VVVRNLDIKGGAIHEPEAEPPLVVDPNAPLSLPTALESLQSAGGWQAKVLDPSGGIDLHQTHECAGLDINRETTRRFPAKQLFGFAVGERFDHEPDYKQYVYECQGADERSNLGWYPPEFVRAGYSSTTMYGVTSDVTGGE